MYRKILVSDSLQIEEFSKGLFNNVKSEMHGPTCYQCL